MAKKGKIRPKWEQLLQKEYNQAKMGTLIAKRVKSGQKDKLCG